MPTKTSRAKKGYTATIKARERQRIGAPREVTFYGYGATMEDAVKEAQYLAALRNLVSRKKPRVGKEH